MLPRMEYKIPIHPMAGRDIEVILTHEHADMDALASLLGAALLYPSAVAVLPREMNRNVREFASLHRNHLPFVPADELPRGVRLQRVILVDTRALNAPRPLAPECAVTVIDHHNAPPDEVIPANWQIMGDPTGANATLLVERIAAAHMELTPVHATLLALGIHEDTGSLTYGGTTHRDAAALAWLLEPARGVNMDVVNQFLHHPLGPGQRALLTRLIDQSEFLNIQGHTVVIAQAAAEKLSEEISAVAARLRDYHEPDAVFLIVDMHELVQVVARSSTDEIDVGAVARALGGGGHPRAAASPVRGRTSAAIRDEIVHLLGEQARAAVTVRDIMSVGRPQTLLPDMTINDAALLMRRYGYEGFPVVAESPTPTGGDALLGVLTRREADRALTHGLGGAAVRRFMRAGPICVRPDDAIPLLRRTMIDSGWGQIPVVDHDGVIIGIVTRTDLIKLWDDSVPPDHRSREMERRLTKSLSPLEHSLLRLVGSEVHALQYTVYVVGGFVRDLLLGTESAQFESLDLDIVIEGDGIAFARHMCSRYGGRVVPHKQFGTAKWMLNDPNAPPLLDMLGAVLGQHVTQADLPAHLDFVSARTEFYTAPTVLPTVESGSIKLDLHRRDFTINTLALCLNPDRWGQLLDFYGGLADLRAGLIRALHSLSFVDDPTRILRAIRYEQRFGFQIEARSLELLADALELLGRVTPARIRHEMERILQEADPERYLQRLDDLGVLQQLNPALHMDAWRTEAMQRLRAAYRSPTHEPLRTEPLERLYWAVLAWPLRNDENAALTERMGLRHATQRLVDSVRRLHHARPQLADPTLHPGDAVELLAHAEPADLDLFGLLCDDAQVQKVLKLYTTTWRHLRPEMDGHDLKALGIPRGPIYRTLLRALRAGRLEGTISSRAEEESLVRSLWADHVAANAAANAAANVAVDAAKTETSIDGNCT